MTNPFALWLSSLPVFRYPGRVQAQWRPLVCPHCTFLFLRKIHPANLRPNPKSRTRPTSPFRIFPSCCDGDDPRSRVIRLATGTTSRTRTYVLYLAPGGRSFLPGPQTPARALFVTTCHHHYHHHHLPVSGFLLGTMLLYVMSAGPRETPA